MIRYTVKRLLLMIPILIGVIVIVFTINYFSTGSPAMAILGTSATPEISLPLSMSGGWIVLTLFNLESIL